MATLPRQTTLNLLSALAIGATVSLIVGCASNAPGTPSSTKGFVTAAEQPRNPGSTASPLSTAVQADAEVPKPARAVPGGPIYAQQPPVGGTGANPDDTTKMLERYSAKDREEILELDAAASYTLARAAQMQKEGNYERALNLLLDLQRQMRGRPGVSDVLAKRLQEVEARRRQIEGLLGHGAGAFVPNAGSEGVSIYDELNAEARAHYEDGVKAMEEGDFKKAEEKFNHVLDMIRFAPSGANLEENFKGKTEDLLRQAQEKGRTQQVEEIDRARLAARELEIVARKRQEQQKLDAIEALWGDVLFNMNLKRFSTAERLCEQILAMDPGFSRARQVKADIQAFRAQDARERNKDRKIDQYRRLWADWYESKIPLAGRNIDYPTGDEWLRIKSRANVAANVYNDPPAVQQTKQILATRTVPMVYTEVTFTQAVKDVAAKSDLRMMIEPSLQPELDKTPVNIQLSNLPLKNSFQLLLDMHRLSYVITEDGFIKIVRAADQMKHERMITRLHDVRDLTARLRGFPSTRIKLHGNGLRGDNSAGANPGPVWEDEAHTTPPLDLNQLQDIITRTIAPQSWTQGGTIQTVAGQLLVRNTPQVQDAISDFVKDMRDVSGLVISVTTRFITIDDMILQDFGIDWRGLGGQSPGNTVSLDDALFDSPDFAGGTVDNAANNIPPGLPIAGLFFNNGTAGTTRDIRGRFENVWDTTLGNILRTTGGLGVQYTIFNSSRDAQFQLVLHALQKNRNASVLNAPRLSAFNTQRATLTVINQVSYVRDFSVTTAVSAAIADPIVDTIMDGLVLDIQPTVSNDRRFVTIELQPQIAELVRPIREFTTTLGGANSTPVTIQLPELVIRAIQTTIMCPDGGVVVVGGIKELRDIDRESGTPILSDIPILGALFRRKGRSLENRQIIIVVKAEITDLGEEESHRR